MGRELHLHTDATGKAIFLASPIKMRRTMIQKTTILRVTSLRLAWQDCPALKKDILLENKSVWQSCMPNRRLTLMSIELLKSRFSRIIRISRIIFLWD